MKVLKLSDRVSIKQNELELVIAPLSYAQKIELAALSKIEAGENVSKTMEQVAKTIKSSVKDVKGLTNYDGSEYVLSYDNGTNSISDECVDELIQTLGNEPILQSILKVIAGEMVIDGAEVSVLPKK